MIIEIGVKTFRQDKLILGLYSRNGDNIESKFDESHAFMIVVASDSLESFQSIDKWQELIRKDNPRVPISLVLVNKNEYESEMTVTEAMVKKKSKESNFEGAIGVNASALVTLATLFTSVADSLPKTAYLKLIDLW